MVPTFVVYIDESGDEGFSLGKGSSEWFVLAAVITRRVEDLDTVKLIDEVRTFLGRPEKKPLHFRDLKHGDRLVLVDRIARANLRGLAILIHKPSLKEREMFQERFRLYFYAARYLLERVSWYCRDHRTPHDAGDGSAKTIFSYRGGMSYAELRDYLRRLESMSATGLDVRLASRVIRPDQVSAYGPGSRMGLQIADAVAGSFFYAVEPAMRGFTEDRYARMLKAIMYNDRGVYRGYGIKFWPRDTDQMLKEEERFAWVRNHYQ